MAGPDSSCPVLSGGLVEVVRQAEAARTLKKALPRPAPRIIAHPHIGGECADPIETLWTVRGLRRTAPAMPGGPRVAQSCQCEKRTPSCKDLQCESGGAC